MEKKYDHTATKDKSSTIPDEGIQVKTTSGVSERIEHFHDIKDRLHHMQPSAKLQVKIALIDDDPYILMTNRMLINSAQHPRYEFVAVPYKFPDQMQDFLNEFQAGGIDGVLTDWDMPSPSRGNAAAGMDGSEVLRYVRNARPEMPIVVNTAASQHEADNIRAAGGGFIAKTSNQNYA